MLATFNTFTMEKNHHVIISTFDLNKEFSYFVPLEYLSLYVLFPFS